MTKISSLVALFLAADLLMQGNLASGNALQGSVSSFAGTGIAGHLDGPSRSAQFISPRAVAESPDQSVIVADVADQAIRRIDIEGNVSTLAGGVGPMVSPLYRAGGFQNGPAKEARFNRPSGVAVDKSGNIFVADSLNHCIREISSGRVTTFSGDSSDGVPRDGSRDEARFGFPVAVAIDREDGRLAVSDLNDGVRLVDQNGAVKTISGMHGIRGLSFMRDSLDTPVIITSGDGGVVELSESGDIIRSINSYDVPPRTQGAAPVGHPFSVAAISPLHMLVTDIRSSDVREYVISRNMAHPPQVRILAGSRLENAGNDDLDYRNGSFVESRFETPTGIVIGRQGVLVADEGAHQIRRLSAWDKRSFEDEIPRVRSAGEIRLALVGNSFAWWDTAFADSIAGKMEAQLDSASVSRKVKVLTFSFSGLSPKAVTSIISNELTDGSVDGVIYLVDSFNVIQYMAPEFRWIDTDQSALRWHEDAKMDFQDIRRTVSDAGLPLLVVYHPFGYEYSTSESLASTMGNEEAVSHSATGSALRKLLEETFPAVLDLWPAFTEYDRSAQLPLFQNFGGHFTPTGRAFVASKIVRYLLAHQQEWRLNRSR